MGNQVLTQLTKIVIIIGHCIMFIIFVTMETGPMSNKRGLPQCPFQCQVQVIVRVHPLGYLGGSRDTFLGHSVLHIHSSAVGKVAGSFQELDPFMTSHVQVYLNIPQTSNFGDSARTFNKPSGVARSRPWSPSRSRRRIRQNMLSTNR
jgi:hypothetical protein